MQYVSMNVLCFITWCLIVTNVFGRDQYNEIYNTVDDELGGKSVKYLSGYDTTNHNYKLNPRNGKKISSKNSNLLAITIQDDRHSFFVELEKVSHHLANEHLPVWKSSSKYPKEYEKLHNVMHNVGNFTMYRDYGSKSALVYFHERDELDGIINRRYYIRKLPKSKLHQVHKVNDEYIFLQGHPFYPIDDEVTESEEEKSEESNENKTIVRVSRELVPEVYPELLVAISFDMFTDIELHSKSPFGVNTVSHILVIFNAVDMLYQSVKSARININIAGIVIEASEDQWDFVKPLTVGEVVERDTRVKFVLEAKNISAKISDYFKQRENYFPRHSYDFIIYNTRNQLSYSSVNVMGMAWHSGFSYMYPAGQDYDRINLAAQDHKSYAHFVVIAHEIAHMMNVEHDPIDETVKNDTTHGSLMLCYKGQCVHGLSWSEATEKTLKQYFRSPAHCILRNHPRSLHPPKPRKTLSVSEQCQCFGFDAFREPDPGDECNEPIVCLDSDDKDLMHVTQLPIDGTPCGNASWNYFHYVCWEEKCVNIDN